MRRFKKKDLIEIAIAYLFMITLIALSSCKAKKTVTTNVEEGSEVEIVSTTKTDSTVTGSSFRLEFDTASFVHLWDAVIYDTSVVDSITKTNPVKAVIKGTSTYSSSSKAVSNDIVTENVSRDDSTKFSKRDTIYIEKVVDKEVKQTGVSQFYGFAIFVLFIFCFWFICKYVFTKVI